MLPSVNTNKFVLTDHLSKTAEMPIGKIQIVQEKLMIVTIFNYIDNLQPVKSITKTDRDSSRISNKISCWFLAKKDSLRFKCRKIKA